MVVADMISLSVTGGWVPVIEHSESSNHGARLFTSAMFLTIPEIPLMLSSLFLRTPYLDRASVPPRFLPGM